MLIEAPLSSRLKSIDALRGFDMFWIIGGDAVAGALAKLTPNPGAQAVLAQVTDHVEWEGFRFYDMIFPLFLFIIGVVLPFSIGKRVEEGESKSAILRKVLLRTGLLFLAGLIYNGLLRFPWWEELRLFGVLQRQAMGYGVAAILLIYTKRRTQAAIGLSALLIYWAVMVWIPVPGHPLGSMTPDGNVANYLDRLMLLPGQMYESYGDPEGLLSTLPAISTALIGVFAGYWLRSAEPAQRKALGLAAAGAACLVLGLLWMPFFPVIKKVWTSSYVLVAGGVSLELLALFYWVIDVRGWVKWSFPLRIIGMNPLTIYMLSEVIDFGKATDYFLGGALERTGQAKDLAFCVGVLGMKWLLLFFLYQKRAFWRL